MRQNYETLVKALELVPLRVISCEEDLISAIILCNQRVLKQATSVNANFSNLETLEIDTNGVENLILEIGQKN